MIHRSTARVLVCMALNLSIALVAHAEGAADKNRACAEYLSRAIQRDSEIFQSEEKLMADAVSEMGAGLSEEDRIAIQWAQKLQPLFEQRLAERAVAAELQQRGIHRGDAIEAYLRFFSAQPMEDQLAIMDGVYRRLMRSLPSRIDGGNVDEVVRLARSTGMKLHDFTDILKKWSQLVERRPQEVRLVILMAIMAPKNEFIAGVRQQQHWWNRLKRYFRRDPFFQPLPQLPPLPAFGEVTHESLVNGSTVKGLVEYLRGVSEQERGAVILDRLGSLSLGTLNMIQNELKNDLSTDIIAALNARRELLMPLHGAWVGFVNASRALSTAEAALEAANQDLANSQVRREPVDMTLVRTLLKDVSRVSSYTDDRLRELTKIVDRYGSRLTDVQSFEVINGILQWVGAMPYVDEKFAVLKLAARQLAQTRMSAEKLSEYKQYYLALMGQFPFPDEKARLRNMAQDLTSKGENTDFVAIVNQRRAETETARALRDQKRQAFDAVAQTVPLVVVAPVADAEATATAARERTPRLRVPPR